ncbi:hypothetical protein BDW74DRAFT_174971 [Aspergillus multicolor]|uniref:uncharacterized protein n=1 Tax=Aspergillus multicolor TaxID=41759 RepID=UPI003CCD6557
MGFLFDKARYFNRALALSVFVIAVSTFNYGFDNQAFATTQAMDAFAKQFGEYNDLNYIGFAAGVIVGSLISARFGRRWCMFTMSVYALVTATITVTSNSNDQIMAARILNYVYVGMELSAVPVFQAEIVPAEVRGFIVGTCQLNLTLGGVVINSVCYGASHLTDNRVWRIPLGLFYIVPSIIAVSILFLPESPRWLLQQGRVEEARASLRKFREGAFTEDQVDKEFRELEFALENEAEQGKKLLMLSSVIMLSGFITMGGLGVNEPVTTQRMKGVISLMVVYGVGFASGWGPLTYVVTTKISSLRLRDHTSRLGFAINICFNFAVNFSIPYLVFEDEVGLQSKMGFIFGAVAFLALVFTYFCVPECKGKTLEQVDWLFNNGVRLRDFGKADASRMLDGGACGSKDDDIEACPAKATVPP